MNRAGQSCLFAGTSHDKFVKITEKIFNDENTRMSYHICPASYQLESFHVCLIKVRVDPFPTKNKERKTSHVT